MEEEKEKRQQKSLVDSLDRISKSIKWLMLTSFVGFLFATISYANDLFDFKQNICQLIGCEVQITGRFSPSGTVPVNTKVDFYYTVPNEGYYSIWNQNREGVLKKIWPINKKTTSAIAPEIEKNQKYPYPLLASTSRSNENIIILWSDNANHPPKKIYSTKREFQEYIDTHHYTWDMKTFSLQVE